MAVAGYGVGMDWVRRGKMDFLFKILFSSLFMMNRIM